MLSVAAIVVAGLLPRPAMADGEEVSGKLKVRATPVELPRTKPCQPDKGSLVTATTRYRLLEVVAGVSPGQLLLVNHRCPEYSRGPSRYGKGSATPMRAGDIHLLTLQRLPGQVKPPRYAALRTDPGRRPPRVVAIISGGGGTNHRLIFDAEQVSVGRAPDADVRLVDRAVAPRHLLVQLKGDQLVITPASRVSQATLLNGLPLQDTAQITFKDRIQIGSYTVKFALFMDPADQS